MRARGLAGARLIVTADDFGAAEPVNEAVERAHRDGILTAASLMVAAPAAADAVRRAKASPGLRVGLHLTLAEGRPMLPSEQVSLLVDADGGFRTDMAAAGARMFFDPVARRQLAAEIEAQFAAFAATGLPLDHVNAHKHFHLHPTIGGFIVRIGRRYGLSAVRAPREPLSVIRKLEPASASFGAGAVSAFARLAAMRFRRAGLLVPDQVFGLAWSGAMTSKRLAGLIRGLPQGLSEIYLHPGLDGEFAGAAAGYRYAEEFAALVDLDVRRATQEAGVQLGGFVDFQTAGAGQMKPGSRG